MACHNHRVAVILCGFAFSMFVDVDQAAVVKERTVNSGIDFSSRPDMRIPVAKHDRCRVECAGLQPIGAPEPAVGVRGIIVVLRRRVPQPRKKTASPPDLCEHARRQRLATRRSEDRLQLGYVGPTFFMSPSDSGDHCGIFGRQGNRALHIADGG